MQRASGVPHALFGRKIQQSLGRIARRGRERVFRRHCEPTGRANARPMTGSAKQSISPRKGRMDCFAALAMTVRLFENQIHRAVAARSVCSLLGKVQRIATKAGFSIRRTRAASGSKLLDGRVVQAHLRAGRDDLLPSITKQSAV